MRFKLRATKASTIVKYNTRRKPLRVEETKSDARKGRHERERERARGNDDKERASSSSSSTAALKEKRQGEEKALVLVHTSVTYFYAFAQNEPSAAQGIIRGVCFFYPKDFSKNILAILVEFSLEKINIKIPNPFYY